MVDLGGGLQPLFDPKQKTQQKGKRSEHQMNDYYLIMLGGRTARAASSALNSIFHFYH